MDPLLLLLAGMAIVVAGIGWLRLHAFVALMAGAIVVASLTPRESIEAHALARGATAEVAATRAGENLGVRVASKFGNTATQLGLMIAMASIVGICLMESGGAERLVRSTLALFGEKRTPLVFLVSGFVLCIPIFFDTVFLLLIPIGRAMAARTGRNFVLYVLCMAAGGVMTHSLVPPTPGPLFVASALHVPLEMMIAGGLVVGAIATLSGFAYAHWANQRWPIPVDAARVAGETSVERSDAELPSFSVAVLPIVLPLVLIAGASISRSVDAGSVLAKALAVPGHPNLALAIAAAFAMASLAWQRRGERQALRGAVQRALADGGVIILITAAGGVFGGVLQETGVGERVADLSREYQLAVLPLAFGITALVRTAQGSATVAMVTAVGILGGLSSPETLGYHPLYLALAIGCGSKLIPWMNDSGFWVVCRTSGFSETQMLRTFSAMLTVMGLVGFGACLIGARFLPLL